MAAPKAKRGFDSLDFFLAFMGLLTIVATFFLFHSWSKLSDLKAAVREGDSKIARIREAAAAAKKETDQGPVEPPEEPYFASEVPAELHGGPKPVVRLRGDENAAEEGWIRRTWLCEWKEISREELALYVRQAEYGKPGVKAWTLDLKNLERPDPYRLKYRAEVVFSFHLPAE
ncbi:MAG: hypothetical protein HY720_24410 [Planctomycetes bacterium]|nr:hypothetical protein [Planctomycetota bacterium]